MMAFGVSGVMSGRGYTVFDTAIGRCGIAWGDSGVLGVQLPEAREIETRRRLLRLYSEARELRPPLNVEFAIEGIVALLRGQPSDLSDVTLDMNGIHAFNARVYAFARTIPRGETRTYGEVASSLRASGAAHSVAQAISKNPFMIIVPCHRVLEAGSYADKISPNGGAISKRRLLSIEGAGSPSSKTLFDVLLPVAPSRPQT
jgi:methylated-DNA-[protein]-cysteine S-methyltransferase